MTNSCPNWKGLWKEQESEKKCRRLEVVDYHLPVQIVIRNPLKAGRHRRLVGEGVLLQVPDPLRHNGRDLEIAQV